MFRRYWTVPCSNLYQRVDTIDEIRRLSCGEMTAQRLREVIERFARRLGRERRRWAEILGLRVHIGRQMQYACH